MSTVLLIVFLLLVGALLAHLMEWRRLRGQRELAVLFMAATSIVWLWTRNRLPLELTLSKWSSTGQDHQWRLVVDEVAWELTFYLFVSILAALIVGALRSGSGTLRQQPRRFHDSPKYTLWLSLAAALALWADSVAGLVLGWMLFDLVWFVHLWSVSGRDGQVRPSLIQSGWLLASTLLLWTAGVDGPGEILSLSDSVALTDPALLLIVLAALLRMGAFPLHWWRSWNADFRPAAMVLVHVLPVILGASLLVRTIPAGGLAGGLLLLFTILGLLGLLAGATWTWSRISEPSLIPATIALGQASALLLVVSWAGSDMALTEARVLFLAPVVLALGSGGSRLRSAWPMAAAVIAIVALAGIPFTAGFDGRAALLMAWQGNGQMILALVVSLLHLALIAAAILAVRIEHRDGLRWKRPALEQATIAMALMLPAIGLLRPGGQSFRDVQAPALGLLLLTAGGSFALSLRVEPVRQVGKSVREAFHAGFFWERLKEVSSITVAAALKAIKEAAAIMEGEGGMLWLLLLVVVLWLARGN